MFAAFPRDDGKGTDALDHLLTRADVTPDAPALSDGTARPLTVGQLASRVRAVAGGLARQGFGEGEQLRLALAPSITSVTLALAAVLTGGSAVIDLDHRSAHPLTPLPSAPHAWVAADSIAFVSATLGRRSTSRQPTDGDTAATSSPHTGDSKPAPDRSIHVGAWLPGVPRSALSMRRLASGALHDAGVRARDHPAVTVVRTAGVVTHSRADLGTAVPWLSRQVRLEPVDRVVTDSLVLGLAALSAGSQWRIGAATPGRRDLAKVSLVGTVRSRLDATCAALTAAGSTAGVVVWDGPITAGQAQRIVPERRLVVLSGRDGLLPVAVTTGSDLTAHDEPGVLLGEVVPGVRVLIDGNRILTRGRRHDGAPTAVDTGLRGRFSGSRLIAETR